MSVGVTVTVRDEVDVSVEVDCPYSPDVLDDVLARVTASTGALLREIAAARADADDPPGLDE